MLEISNKALYCAFATSAKKKKNKNRKSSRRHGKWRNQKKKKCTLLTTLSLCGPLKNKTQLVKDKPSGRSLKAVVGAFGGDIGAGPRVSFFFRFFSWNLRRQKKRKEKQNKAVATTSFFFFPSFFQRGTLLPPDTDSSALSLSLSLSI